MNRTPPNLLYDALQRLESSRAIRRAYPVHKKLSRETLGCNDIYDWILERINLPPEAAVLDAGCGVGFGTQKLARAGARFVTGISLSRREIRTACRLLRRTDLEDRVRYELRSYDELPRKTYDLVVAVEALKHSERLGISLRSLIDSLKPGGRLVVIDDFCTGAGEPRAAVELVRCWGLARLFTQRDYGDVLGAESYEFHDLTPAVRRTGRVGRLFRLSLVRCAAALTPSAAAVGWRAMRGGIRLEQLYADGAMTYGALDYRRPGEISR